MIESMPILVRDAGEHDVAPLATVDSIAAGGDHDRRAAIVRWVGAGAARVAADNKQVLGYCVVEHTFFEQAFVVMLMVAEHARCRGVGARLLADAAARHQGTKLFTSTNLSNHPMQRLLARLSWQSAGIVYGLDQGDPELIFLAA